MLGVAKAAEAGACDAITTSPSAAMATRMATRLLMVILL